MGRQSIYINSLIIVYIILKTIYNYLYWMGNTCMSTMKILFLVLKWKKTPQFWKQKSNHLSYIISTYFYSHKPWKPIMTSEIIYSQILITWYMIFIFFSHFSSFEFYWNSLFWSACIIVFSILTFVCKSCI